MDPRMETVRWVQGAKEVPENTPGASKSTRINQFYLHLSSLISHIENTDNTFLHDYINKRSEFLKLCQKLFDATTSAFKESGSNVIHVLGVRCPTAMDASMSFSAYVERLALTRLIRFT